MSNASSLYMAQLTGKKQQQQKQTILIQKKKSFLQLDLINLHLQGESPTSR